MKTVDYEDALTRFRKHCNKNYVPENSARGRPSKTGLNPGVITEAGRHYGLKPSQMSEILLHSRNKVMNDAMLQDIGLKRESVLVRKGK